MPFFFIVPLWLVCLVVGTILTFFPHSRRFGYFFIAVPTGATVVSFLLSTAALFLLPRLLPQPSRPWYGVFLLVTYLVAIGLGALLGGFAAFWAMLKSWRAR